MPSDFTLPPHPRSFPFFSVGVGGGGSEASGAGGRLGGLPRPKSMAAFLTQMRREADAKAAYLLRGGKGDAYAAFVSQGDPIGTLKLPTLLVPMQTTLPLGDDEAPATLVPLESVTFGDVLLLLVHDRRPRLTAKDLERLADKATFLFVLVENELLRRVSRSMLSGLASLSALALSGELTEDDLAHVLTDVLRTLLEARRYVRARVAGEAFVVEEGEGDLAPEEFTGQLGEAPVAATATMLLARTTFGEKTAFYAFEAEQADVMKETAALLVRTAEETYRRHRSDQGVREAVERLSRLYQLEREFAGDRDPKHIVRRTLEEVASASASSVVALVTHLEDDVVVVTATNLEPRHAEGVFGSEPLRKFVLAALDERRSRVVFRRDLPPDVRYELQKLHLETLILLPVALGGEGAGVVALGFHEECLPEEDLLEHLTALAVIGVQAFSRQTLSLERQAVLDTYRSLALITDIALSNLPLEELLTTLGDRLAEVLQPQAVAIFLAPSDEEHLLRPVRLTGALAHLGPEDLTLAAPEAESALGTGLRLIEPRDPAPTALRHLYGRVAALAFRSQTRLVGVVRLDFPLGRRLVDAELDLLRLAGERLSYVVEMRDLLRRYQDLYVSSVLALAGAVDAKDPYTRDHSEQVARYARAIAESLRLTTEEVEEIAIAGLLHDVGKIAVPDALINKPEPLTPEEFEIVKTHAEQGARIVEQGPALRHLAPIIRYHHERPDGRGYFRLRGAEAPLGSYIIAVADAFDTMTTDRPYRQAMSVEEAMAELRRNRGTQFLPSVVDAFAELYAEGKLPLRQGLRPEERPP